MALRSMYPNHLPGLLTAVSSQNTFHLQSVTMCGESGNCLFFIMRFLFYGKDFLNFLFRLKKPNKYALYRIIPDAVLLMDNGIMKDRNLEHV